MKKIKSLTTLLVFFFAASANAQSDELRIKANMPELPNDSTVFLYEPQSDEWDTTVIKNHSFTIIKKMPKGGSVHILKIGRSPEETTGTVFYLEPGDLNITGKGPYFMNATYTGSPFVKEWLSVSQALADSSANFKGAAELIAKSNEAARIGDDAAAEKYGKEAAKFTGKTEAIAKEWVKNNPNSGVAGYVISNYFYQFMSKDSILLAINNLGPHAKKSRILYRVLNPGKDVNTSLTVGEAQGLKIADPAPSFTLPDVNGKMVSLSDFKGKYVFVDFWASWCKPCLVQNPFIKTAFEKYKNKNLEIVGISLDDKHDRWVNGIKKEELNWIQLSQLQGWNDSVAKDYFVGAIPANFLISPDGKIVASGLYGEDLLKKLDEILKK